MNDQLMTTVILPVIVSVLSVIVATTALIVDIQTHKKAKKEKESSDGLAISMGNYVKLLGHTPINVVPDENASAYVSKSFATRRSLYGKKKKRTKCAIYSSKDVCTKEQILRAIMNNQNTEFQKKYIIIIDDYEHDLLMRLRACESDSDNDRDQKHVAALRSKFDQNNDVQ